jgi:hypothetical protein
MDCRHEWELRCSYCWRHPLDTPCDYHYNSEAAARAYIPAAKCLKCGRSGFSQVTVEPWLGTSFPVKPESLPESVKSLIPVSESPTPEESERILKREMGKQQTVQATQAKQAKLAQALKKRKAMLNQDSEREQRRKERNKNALTVKGLSVWNEQVDAWDAWDDQPKVDVNQKRRFNLLFGYSV